MLIIDWGVLVSALIDGVSYAMMVFVIAVGLVIIFGLMDVFNLAHAVLFSLGAYLFIQVYVLTGNYFLSLAIPTVIGFVLGALIERAFIKPLYGKHVLQLLLTMGLMILFLQILQVAWPAGLYFPETKIWVLSGMINVLGTRIRVYKFIVIIGGIMVFVAINTLLSKTRFGAMLRAGTENRELAEAFGININILFAVAFSLGTGLALFGGALVAPLTHATIELPLTFTLLAFVVPVVGGMKNYRGSFFASLLIGIIDRLVAYYFSWLSFAIDLIVMIAVLLLKPEGLFGGE